MTAPDAEMAARVGRSVVEDRLAACVNIVPGVRSIYVFDNKLCDEAEVLCVLKTRRALYPALRDRITALHPYEVPEIVAVPASQADPDYAAWVAECVPPQPA